MSSDTRPAMVLWVPGVVAVLTTTIFVLAECADHRPFEDPPMTVSEAAAEGEAHVMLRQLHGGASPVARYAVGRDMKISEETLMLTPLEAATARDQDGVIGILERWGVPIDDRERARLLCLAERAGAQQALGVLTRPGIKPACDATVPAVKEQ